ncbi:uncharacterized protein BO66DRAFT_450906 [Aspergillus aculeatinus CBS 121060]|uniref:Uncharacterized protein n=1 Tax=Aspergillus aculeatinus CBS 121060 TaxID=1448322 RepID=A0ACD1HAW4_9EURO|nr:hypothetical protein BO66DRAFT_450906 [Aspergillus aculeatinus CBS 121060]RAH70539.1 hypothetical protein BO66DRAFT_450906 [Aspergillus aculeatinus CBS 121060]
MPHGIKAIKATRQQTRLSALRPPALAVILDYDKSFCSVAYTNLYPSAFPPSPTSAAKSLFSMTSKVPSRPGRCNGDGDPVPSDTDRSQDRAGASDPTEQRRSQASARLPGCQQVRRGRIGQEIPARWVDCAKHGDICLVLPSIISDMKKEKTTPNVPTSDSVNHVCSLAFELYEEFDC